MHKRHSGLITVAYYKKKESHSNNVISRDHGLVSGEESPKQCLIFRLFQRLMPESLDKKGMGEKELCKLFLMNYHDLDNVAGLCSITGVCSGYLSSPLAGMEEPTPESISSNGPDTRISLVSVPSKDIQVHRLTVGTIVPSDVITHIIIALTLGSNMRSNLLLPKQGGKKKKSSAIQET